MPPLDRVGGLRQAKRRADDYQGPHVDCRGAEAREERRAGGLRFRNEDAPGWGEFLDQAFVIGCAPAAADVNATSRSMRRACLAHGVVAFFFNTIILALMINIGAGLI